MQTGESRFIDETERLTGVVRPCVVFDRTVNKGMRDKYHVHKDQKTGESLYKELVQTGERQELWPCFLANPKGELFTWATMLGMQQYIAKGWQPVELIGFEEFFKRKTGGDMVTELRTMYEMMSNHVQSTRRLQSLLEENERLKASADPDLIGQMMAKMKELEEQLKTQGEQFEKERKENRERKAQEKKASQ